MKKEDVVIGQTYRIRRLSDMAKEFGIQTTGSVYGPSNSFIPRMRVFCGQEYTPAAMFSDGNLSPPMNGYYICAWMLEPLATEDPEEVMG